MQVIEGDAHLSKSDTANQCLISAKDQTILHWDRFSIASSEEVRFVQPSSHAAVLNRVTGKGGSELLGRLSSNGKVFLINPRGVLIGPNAQIETSSFIASSLDLLDQDFLLAADLRFFGDGDGDVVNLGSIASSIGDVLLIARNVRNEGSLSAPHGLAALAAGCDVLVHHSGAERIFIRPYTDHTTSVSHTGSITSIAAELKTGANPYSLGIQMSGQIDAYDSQEINGRTFLIAEGSSCDLSGTIVSPEVYCLADQIHLYSTALIDASKDTGGGTVLIGGGERGRPISVPNANSVFVEPGAEILADARFSGDGGKVVVWSDDTTQFEGHISAQAFGSTGNGGQAEISGKRQLACSGLADLRSQQGDFGSLLLDPTVNITIQSGPNVAPVMNVYNDGYINAQLALANFTIDSSPDQGFVTFDPGMGDVNINWSALTRFQLLVTSITDTSSLTWNITSSNVGSFTAVDFQANAGSGVIGTGTFDGIGFQHLVLATQGGNINFVGKGGDGTGMSVDPNQGISLATFVHLSTNTGSITLNGTGGASAATTLGHGLVVFYNSTIITQTGTVNLTGTGSTVCTNPTVGAKFSRNVQVRSEGTSGAGPVTITGTGGTMGSGTNNGVTVENETLFRTKNAVFTVNGTAQGANGSFSNDGILIQPGTGTISQLLAQGTGSFVLTGMVGNSNVTGSSTGIHLIDSAQIGLSDASSLSMTGTGAGTDFSNIGVYFDGVSNLGSPTITNGTGTITITGTGSQNSTMDHNIGVYFRGTIGAIGIGGTTGATTITGTSGTGSGGDDVGILVESSFGGPIDFITSVNGSISLIGTAHSTDPAILIVDANGVTTTGTGNISVTTLGSTSDAQIGSGDTANSPATVRTTGTGIITFDIARDLILDAIGGQSASISMSAMTTGDMLLKAGRDIVFTTTGGGAIVENLGTGNITLVVDNNFPSPFGIGPGAFTYGTGGQINAANMAAEVRIYTARAIQNSINASINGEVFTPGTSEEDKTYFPGGTYLGPNFTIYYKTGLVPPFGPTPDQIANAIDQGAVASAAPLAMLLPFRITPYFFNTFFYVNDKEYKLKMFWIFQPLSFDNRVY
jgi:filamentous hemagglutinin family protein